MKSFKILNKLVFICLMIIPYVSMQCTGDCIKCSTDNRCLICRSNYDVIGSDCVKLVDIYCTKIDASRTSCSACASGYKIVNERCEICQVPGCKKCDTDITKCDECYEGQFRSSDSSSCSDKCSVNNLL